MSTDERVASQLVKTLVNGKLGCERAADRLEPILAQQMARVQAAHEFVRSAIPSKK